MRIWASDFSIKRIITPTRSCNGGKVNRNIWGKLCDLRLHWARLSDRSWQVDSNDLSTTVELGQASNAMRRASSTILLFNTANVTYDWLARDAA